MSSEIIPSKVGIENAFTYATYTIIYLNDCAANCCLDVCRQVDKANYKGNGAKKICRGLQNRAIAYFDLFNKVFKETIDIIAEFNCVYDDFCDKPLLRFRRIITDILNENNVTNAEFIGYVETCRAVCAYACEMNDYMVKKLIKYAPEVVSIKNWRVTPLSNVANDLADFVCEVSNAKGINLNDNKELIEEFKKWQENMFLYENFKTAFKAATEAANEKNNNINH
jgi:hypothetical protein